MLLFNIQEVFVLLQNKNISKYFQKNFLSFSEIILSFDEVKDLIGIDLLQK